MTEQQTSHALTDIIDQLEERSTDTLSIDDTLSAFGTRLFGPFITAVGLICISPVGALPGLPAILAIAIILLSGQILLGRSHLWLPGAIRDRRVKGKHAREALRKMRKVARPIDRVITPRFEFLFNSMSKRVVAAICILLALSMIPMEVVPYAVLVPATALCFFGLALINHDGLLLIAGGVATLGGAVAFWLIL